MRRGVRLALDLGERRIGVARCDVDGLLAVPLMTLDGSVEGWVDEVLALVREYEPIELVVGNPVSLRGLEEQASLAVRARVQTLVPRLEVPVRLVDERLTSASAMRGLRAAGHDARSARGRIDAAAAVELLEFALESERRTGAPAGEIAT